MKLINRETVKGAKLSAKTVSLASVLLTGTIALTATGCDAQIKADGITIDSLTISGSAAEDFLDNADIKINGQDVDLTDIKLPDDKLDTSVPSSNANKEIELPADNFDTPVPSSNDKKDTELPEDNFDSEESAPVDAMALYDAFLNGKATAGYRSYGETYDCGSSLSDLVSHWADYELTTSIDIENCVKFIYMDCGMDGNKELMLQINFERLYEEGSNYYVIKEFDGKLYITYSIETWSRHFVEIAEDGEVDIYFSNGSHDHGFAKGVLDADGDYQQLYYCDKRDIEVGYGFDFYDENNNWQQIAFYTDGLDIPYKDWSIYEIFIGDDTKAYYTYSVWDADYKDTTTEENFYANDRIVGIMNYYGLPVFDHSQIEDMIFAKACDLGAQDIVSIDIDGLFSSKY